MWFSFETVLNYYSKLFHTISWQTAMKYNLISAVSLTHYLDE